MEEYKETYKRMYLDFVKNYSSGFCYDNTEPYESVESYKRAIIDIYNKIISERGNSPIIKKVLHKWYPLLDEILDENEQIAITLAS